MMTDSGLIPGNSRPERTMIPVEAPVPIEVSAVRKFMPCDIDDWMMGRLAGRWPLVPAASWLSKLTSFTNSNASFFVTNERCVLLMTVACAHAITAKPIVLEVFALSRDAHFNKDDKVWVLPPEGNVPLSALYRAGREWMKGMGAGRMIAGTCSDMAPSTVKNATGGYYIVDLVNGL